MCVCVLVTNIICLRRRICSKNRKNKTSYCCHPQLIPEQTERGKKSVLQHPAATTGQTLFANDISWCTWCEEFPALEVVRLASALVAVGVVTREAVHHVVVLGAGAILAVAEFRKVAGVHGLSAWGSCNSELRRRRRRRRNKRKQEEELH